MSTADLTIAAVCPFLFVTLNANTKIKLKIIIFEMHQSILEMSLILIPIDLCIMKPRWQIREIDMSMSIYTQWLWKVRPIATLL